MQKTKKLELIVSVLLKGTGMTGELLSKYCEILFNGLILKVSYHDIEYNKLSREERDLFSVRMVNGLIQTLKLNKIPRNTKITKPMLIQAILEANPRFKKVMHQLMQWMASCAGEIRQELSAFLVTVMCRSPEENVAFGYLHNREFVLDNMDSLFEILLGLFYDEEYPFSVQVGERFRTFEVVKKNEQLFKDVFAEEVSNMPEPKPEAETESEDEDDDAGIPNEFNADSAEFPGINEKKVDGVAKASVPFIFEEVKKPAPVEVVEKPTVTGKDELLKVLGSDLPPGLKVKVMQMLSSSV